MDRRFETGQAEEEKIFFLPDRIMKKRVQQAGIMLNSSWGTSDEEATLTEFIARSVEYDLCRKPGQSVEQRETKIQEIITNVTGGMSFVEAIANGFKDK